MPSSQVKVKVKPYKKLSGIPYFSILLVVILKDIFDWAATLTVILYPFTLLFSFVAYAIITVYFIMNKVPIFGRRAARKMALFIGGLILENIYTLQLVPITTLTFIITCFIENRVRKAKNTKIFRSFERAKEKLPLLRRI